MDRFVKPSEYYNLIASSVCTCIDLFTFISFASLSVLIHCLVPCWYLFIWWREIIFTRFLLLCLCYAYAIYPTFNVAQRNWYLLLTNWLLFNSYGANISGLRWYTERHDSRKLLWIEGNYSTNRGLQAWPFTLSLCQNTIICKLAINLTNFSQQYTYCN